MVGLCCLVAEGRMLEVGGVAVGGCELGPVQRGGGYEGDGDGGVGAGVGCGGWGGAGGVMV